MEGLLKNDLFKTYAVHVGLLTIKMNFMVIKTIMARMKYKAYHTPEDEVYLKSPMKSDDRVERIRKCHLNDMENNYLFMAVSLLYVTTNPSPTLATWLFRIFTASRFLHMYVYTIQIVPQPARAYSWLTGFFIISYMGFATITHYMSFI